MNNVPTQKLFLLGASCFLKETMYAFIYILTQQFWQGNYYLCVWFQNFLLIFEVEKKRVLLYSVLQKVILQKETDTCFWLVCEDTSSP